MVKLLKADLPREVVEIGERRAPLSERCVSHSLRHDFIGAFSRGERDEEMSDITKWVEEECEYTRRGILDAAADLKTIDALHESGELDDDQYDAVERWLSEDIEQLYRDHTALVEMVAPIDSREKTHFVHDLEIALEGREQEDKTMAKETPSVSQRLQDKYRNFGDFGE